VSGATEGTSDAPADGGGARGTAVIAIDGPVGSGKGAVSGRVARRLGWHLLESGALYRALALAAEARGVDADNVAALARVAGGLDVRFVPGAGGGEQQVVLDGEDAGEAIRSQACGERASRVAVLEPVRRALLARQRAFRRPPGLVADGRDMGTVVFPDAEAKIFLTASLEERARRRHKQLIEKGIDVSLDSLFREVADRDRRDRERAVAPLRPAPDAWVLDSTGRGIDEIVDAVLAVAVQRGAIQRA